MELPDLPDGFTLVRSGRGSMACRPSDEEPLRRAGFLPDGKRGAEGFADAEESGREPLGLLEVGGRACLARRFTHGGLLRAVTGARFLDPARPFTELVLSQRLRALEIPTPRVVAARAVRSSPLGYELTLVTEREEGVEDLGWMLGNARRDPSRRPDLEPAIRAAARTISELHRAGFVHADLQPANILFRRKDSSAIAIDLDGSRFEPTAPLARELAVKNLGRLYRHVARREADYGTVLTPRHYAAFLREYARALGAPTESVRQLAKDIVASSERRGLLHRLGWWAEARLGRKQDKRAAKPAG